MLVLAHATGVCLLRSDTVEGVVSMRGDPGEHLERCCNPLIRMLLDSDSQQETENRVKRFMFYWDESVDKDQFHVISIIINTHVNYRNNVTSFQQIVTIHWVRKVFSPLLLQGVEVFPEGRADLT